MPRYVSYLTWFNRSSHNRLHLFQSLSRLSCWACRCSSAFWAASFWRRHAAFFTWSRWRSPWSVLHSHPTWPSFWAAQTNRLNRKASTGKTNSMVFCAEWAPPSPALALTSLCAKCATYRTLPFCSTFRGSRWPKVCSSRTQFTTDSVCRKTRSFRGYSYCSACSASTVKCCWPAPFRQRRPHWCRSRDVRPRCFSPSSSRCSSSAKCRLGSRWSVPSWSPPLSCWPRFASGLPPCPPLTGHIAGSGSLWNNSFTLLFNSSANPSYQVLWSFPVRRPQYCLPFTF